MYVKHVPKSMCVSSVSVIVSVIRDLLYSSKSEAVTHIVSMENFKSRLQTQYKLAGENMTVRSKKVANHYDESSIENYNHGHNILRLLGVSPNFPFAASATKRYY